MNCVRLQDLSGKGSGFGKLGCVRVNTPENAVITSIRFPYKTIISYRGLRPLIKFPIVEELMPSKDGLIREVKVRVGDPTSNRKGIRIKTPTILERPIHNLVLLLVGDQGIPDEEPCESTT